MESIACLRSIEIVLERMFCVGLVLRPQIEVRIFGGGGFVVRCAKTVRQMEKLINDLSRSEVVRLCVLDTERFDSFDTAMHRLNGTSKI